MRIIKFRLAVKCRICEKVSFRFGTLCPAFRIVEDGDESCPRCHSYQISVIKNGQFEQSTGLHDSKGVEIFEGDMVEFSEFDYNGRDTQRNGVVKYCGSSYQIWQSEDNEYYDNDGAFALDWAVMQDDEFRIIGNIYSVNI